LRAPSLIPSDAANAIERFCETGVIDRARFRRSYEAVGFPIVGLVEQLAEAVPNGHGEYAHWGATTQDIMDTALVLALRRVLGWAADALDALNGRLVMLAQRHRDTRMVGRSQLQHAVPITFGLKVAGWLSGLARHRRRLRELRPRVLRVQLGGAVGTLASLGPVGFEVRAALARKLNLSEPEMTWHTQRDALAELHAGPAARSRCGRSSRGGLAPRGQLCRVPGSIARDCRSDVDDGPRCVAHRRCRVRHGGGEHGSPFGAAPPLAPLSF
jgi:3-carboxy-cis,cis-muconate cycloisomerase